MTKVRIKWHVEADYDEEFDVPDDLNGRCEGELYHWAIGFIANNIADDDFQPVGFDRDVDLTEVVESDDGE